MEDDGTRRVRRKRYAGKHPRRFEDKYKEHRRDEETLAKVREAGKTPAGMHVPILVAEVLEVLRLRPGLVGVDATLGYGGHARAILERVVPGGRLVGLDVDPQEQPKAVERLAEAGYGGEVLIPVRSNYAGVRKVLDGLGWEAVDFVFADLGCSSMQIDNPERGFSWKVDGPLDMRMNPERGVSAEKWLEKVKVEKLAEVLVEHADEPQAGVVAEALAGKRWSGTLALAEGVRGIPEVSRLDGERVELTVRRVFQAVRIAVNEEFIALDAFLRVLPACVRSGGRVAILTFHSGEDRRVKKAFQQGLKEGVWGQISDGVVVAGADERRDNPRSVPAKLRWAERA